MKKTFLTAGMIMMAATITLANNTNNGHESKEARSEKKEARKENRKIRRAESRNTVSYFTKNQFAIDFNDAKDVQYLKTNNFEEVEFLSGGKSLRAFFDFSHTLVGTTRQINFAGIPVAAQKKILQKYAGYSVKDVIKFEDNEDNETDMIMYGNSFEDADNYFVELKKDDKDIVVKADKFGDVSFFKDIK